jgi:hypothetical protein
VELDQKGPERAASRQGAKGALQVVGSHEVVSWLTW